MIHDLDIGFFLTTSAFWNCQATGTGNWNETGDQVQHDQGEGYQQPYFRGRSLSLSGQVKIEREYLYPHLQPCS